MEQGFWKSDSLVRSFSKFSEFLQSFLNSFCELVGIDKKFAFAYDAYPRATELVNEVDEFITASSKDENLLVTRASNVCSALHRRVVRMIVDEKQDIGFQRCCSGLLKECRVRLEKYQHTLEMH